MAQKNSLVVVCSNMLFFSMDIKKIFFAVDCFRLDKSMIPFACPSFLSVIRMHYVCYKLEFVLTELIIGLVLSFFRFIELRLSLI